MTEKLFTGAVVLTMDEARPRAGALLIRGNRVAAVGDSAELRQRASPSAEVIDLAGRAVIPGFNDGHAHAQDAGREANQLHIDGMHKDELFELLREEDRRLPQGRPLIAGQWDEPDLPDPRLAELDRAVPDRPVYLVQRSGHGAWVNSATLRMLNIGPDTPEWDGGGTDRDGEGNLNGVLREPGGWPGMQKLWLRMVRDKDAARENLARALVTLAEHGITSVQDNTWFPWFLDALSRASREGRLTARFSCWSMGAIPLLDFWFSHKRFRRDWYFRGPRKFQLDGAFSTHTAWLTEPYSDRPDTSGSGVSIGKIGARVESATRSGRQLACHSIGDAATRAYVAAVEAVGDRGRAKGLRHRVEHGQLVCEADIERAVRLGMVFCGQPAAAAEPLRDVKLLGEERAARAYPYRALLDAGVPLAFGSDYPGESVLNPFQAIHSAVNRDPQQAIPVERALHCYTAGSAYAEFRENDKGKLMPGYLADFVVVDSDPTEVDPSTIRDIRVNATFVDGRQVYSRDQ